MTTVYEIDGRDFSTLEEFYDVVSRVQIPGAAWGRNLDAFNDVLRGGFGTPDAGFTLRWENHQLSKDRLGSSFETLLEIVRTHGPGGDEAEDGVELVLA